MTLFIIQRRFGDSGELLSTDVLQSFAVKIHTNSSI